jgi:chemotaxis protein CheC
MISMIGEEQRDAVTEILNIAIGRAAASLSELVDDAVQLSVPFVDFLPPAEAVGRLETETGGAATVAVRQHFDGRFYGDIMLIFPEERSLSLVRHMVGEEVPLDQLTELEQEALLEVGNIILNACLGSLSNQLNMPVHGSLPTYVRSHRGQVFRGDGADQRSEEIVMFLHVNFSLVSSDIHGYLAFVMDIASAGNFVEAINVYIDSVLGT